MGKIAHQAEMVSKADQKDSVLRAEHVLEENLQIILMLFRKMILASARIDHQTKCQRHIGAAGEERYFLRYCIFDYVYIVLREIVHQSAARIAGYERHADQIHFDAYRLLPAAD